MLRLIIMVLLKNYKTYLVGLVQCVLISFYSDNTIQRASLVDTFTFKSFFYKSTNPVLIPQMSHIKHLINCIRTTWINMLTNSQVLETKTVNEKITWSQHNLQYKKTTPISKVFNIYYFNKVIKFGKWQIRNWHPLIFNFLYQFSCIISTIILHWNW